MASSSCSSDSRCNYESMGYAPGMEMIELKDLFLLVKLYLTVGVLSGSDETCLVVMHAVLHFQSSV